MSYLVRFEHDGRLHVEDVAAADDAVARVRELHEGGNASARVYREVAVRVETVVHVSLDDGPSTPPAPAPADDAAADVTEDPEPAATDGDGPGDDALWQLSEGVEDVELPALPAFFDEPDDEAPAPAQAPPPPPRRAVTAVDFVARSS